MAQEAFTYPLNLAVGGCDTLSCNQKGKQSEDEVNRWVLGTLLETWNK